MKKGKKFIVILIAISLNIFLSLRAQENSLVNTSNSPHSSMYPVDFGDVKWTKGFWAERFEMCKNTMVPGMLAKYMDDTISHGFANFEIAAGLKEGDHQGPPFHDGDFYKMLEGLIAAYSYSHDPETDQMLDSIITIIGKTQRDDGYIHTPVIIEQRKNKNGKQEFSERLDFETYNMGHLMTAACLHYRVTGKTDLLRIAEKAADFLYNYYRKNPSGLAKNAICPSHYMGITEMYRTTHDPRYLELANTLIDIRSMVEKGTDHNQDRIPFREQTKAVGHAVRANYLYAGAADVYMETGDDSLMKALEALWHDVTERKLYITGACGALYDGVSPNGTTYDPGTIQQVHQAYGQDYQLPNLTAHNESCANIGNLMWNWRMLLATADPKYADIMEMVMYNSLLAGVSLDGKGYFYTNPLAVSQDLPYTLRWSKEREEYISYCNCCPPNTIRTIAEINDYLYGLSDRGVYINFFGGNTLETKLKGGQALELEQVTDYPWSGNILIDLQKMPTENYSVYIRIPGWCDEAVIRINGRETSAKNNPGEYTELNRKWQGGDRIEIELPVKARLIEAHPLLEETRNQVAIRRGPVIYCLESFDIPEQQKLSDVIIPADIQLIPEKYEVTGSTYYLLCGDALLRNTENWNNQLYREVSNEQLQTIELRFLPYYAWGNRGKGDMSVWFSLDR